MIPRVLIRPFPSISLTLALKFKITMINPSCMGMYICIYLCKCVLTYVLYNACILKYMHLSIYIGKNIKKLNENVRERFRLR